MSTGTYLDTTITAVRRGKFNTRDNGNPHYQVSTTDGIFPTLRDGAVNHGIDNEDYRTGVVRLYLRDGEIIGISRPDGSDWTGGGA